MNEYNNYEITDKDVEEGFESLIQKQHDYTKDKDVFEDYIYIVNNEHDQVFYELLYNEDREITDFVKCKDYAFKLLQRQKSIINMCNQAFDIADIRAELKELKDYLKKYYKRLSNKKINEIKTKIKNYSEEVILLNDLLKMKDLDDRSNSNELVNDHQDLLKTMRTGVKYDVKNKKYELDFSSLQKISKKKRQK
ncbi:MAG: hypothetical protein ACPGR2_13710 [Psychrobium sp.]